MSSRLLGVMQESTFARWTGRPAYWKRTGIHIRAAMWPNSAGPGSNIADIYIDQREFGYAVQRVSTCALFDPKPTRTLAAALWYS